MMKNNPFKSGSAGPRRPAGAASALLATALTASMLLASGCASYNRDHFTVGSVPDDYRTRHPIVVSESERAQDIVVPRHLKRLPLRDRDLVRQMGMDFRASGASSIAILIPSGSPNEKAARNAAHDAVMELNEVGIGSGRILIKHYDAASHGSSATLRLAFTDLSAEVNSKCGDWNEDVLDTRENRNYSNFGCATQNNLAQMIANPADLLGPRGMSEIDSTKRTAIIEEWRLQGSELERLER